LVDLLCNFSFPFLSYKQRRFNLFREESEGFAKLITELNQEFDENTTPESIMDIIKSLIGNTFAFTYWD